MSTRTRKRIGLRDIARRAGVATGTVSMVLNRNPLVSDPTRAHVQQVIRELDYVYNRAAAQLRNKRTNIVGVSVCNLTNPYFAAVASGIERTMDDLGRVIVLGNGAESVARQARFLDTLLEYNVEGIMLLPVVGTPKSAVERLFQWRIPVVMVSRYIAGVEADYAGPENRLGTLLATRHLIALGHERLAFVGRSRRTSTGRDRIAGFRAALRETRLTVPPELIIECDATRECGFQAVGALFALRSPPTAIVCFNDLLAFGVMLGLRQRGLEPGRDCSVVGFDNVTEAALWRPSLTTVGVDVAGIGQAAGTLWRNRVDEPKSPARRIIIEPSLFVRESCGPVPAPVGKRRRA